MLFAFYQMCSILHLVCMFTVFINDNKIFLVCAWSLVTSLGKKLFLLGEDYAVQ